MRAHGGRSFVRFSLNADASVEDFDSLRLLSAQSHEFSEFYSLQQSLPGIVNGLRQFINNLAAMCAALTVSGRSGLDPRLTAHGLKLVSFRSHLRAALQVVRTSVLDLVCGAVSSDFQALSTHANGLLQELQTTAAVFDNVVPCAARPAVPAYATQAIASALRRTVVTLAKIETMLHAGELRYTNCASISRVCSPHSPF